MITREQIDSFLAAKALAVVGVSRDPRKFGHKAFKDLLDKGYRAYAVNPQAPEILKQKTYPDVASLPKDVEGLVLVVPPAQTEKVMREAHAAGHKRVWLQPGAESLEAIRYGEGNGMTVIHGICLMMQAEPVRSFHKIHRFFSRLSGKVPKKARP